MRRGCFLLALIGLLSGCSDSENDHDKTISIGYLKQIYKGYPVEISGEKQIRAVVISDARQGNFNRSIILEDASGGIELRVDLKNSFEKYRRGETLIVRCNTLTLGSYGGALQLGAAPRSTYETDPIPADKLASYIRVADIAAQEITPHTVYIGNLTKRYIHCWVRLEEVQFIEEERLLTWGEIDEDVNRHLINRSGDTLLVRVNGGSTLANALLPQGSGSIEGVLSFFNNAYQLRPISPAENDMTHPRF